MKYLEIKNGKCVGWVMPMYHHEAVEFAKEVKKVCEAGSKGTGIIDTPNGVIKTKHTNYKYQDGTRFVITIDKSDGTLVEIEAKYTDSEDFETVYYNAG